MRDPAKAGFFVPRPATYAACREVGSDDNTPILSSIAGVVRTCSGPIVGGGPTSFRAAGIRSNLTSSTSGPDLQHSLSNARPLNGCYTPDY